MKRQQEERIAKDLEKKMVFLTGPRQVGKTWLSRQIENRFDSPLYLNFDSLNHRKIIQDQSWLPSVDLLILDEIYKMENWKNYLKGVYDTKPNSMKILVTGSARLETFRGTGDSLAGRFFRHQLLPLSLQEIENPSIENLEKFIENGEFPEPFLAESTTDAQRWRQQYIDGLIREDILDFEKIHDFKKIQLTLKLLQERVGSPISYSSIANDIAASPHTVKRYIEIFEALYIVFRVTPFSKNIARSILKEPKIYFFDTGMVKGDAGVVLENHVALSLLKDLTLKEDSTGICWSLNYLRNKEGKEVDFCRVQEGEVFDMIEVKLSNEKISPSLRYFQKRFPFPAKQIVRYLDAERVDQGIEVLNVFRFLKNL